MDYRNNSMPHEEITSFDVNKPIQRSLTKAVARHGLGLYIYAGEALPEDERAAEKAKKDSEMDNAMALQTVVLVDKHKGKTLKEVYKTARDDINEVYSENGDRIKQAITTINEFIEKSKK